MALKALMLRKKINEKKSALEELRTKDADFEKREAELEAAVNEAETEEEQNTVEEEVNFAEIGRTSINVAKQMLKQKIKEYEKQKVFDEYKDKEFDLISGIIKTVEDKFVLVDIKTTIGILLKSEQIPGEVYREGQTIRTIIKEVSK